MILNRNKSLTSADIEVFPISSHLFDFSDFDCGKKQYNDYLLKTAHSDHKNNIGKVWLFIHKRTRKVVSYVTLAMSQLHKSEHKKLGELTTHGYIPGLLLGQMARDNEFRGMKTGELMINWVIAQAIELSKRIGCRLIILQSDDDQVQMYETHGFLLIPNSKKKRNMMFYDLSWYKQ